MANSFKLVTQAIMKENLTEPTSKPMEVELTWAEMNMAAAVGCRRHIEAQRLGRKDKHGFEGQGWNIHIEGACAEMAYAKAKGVFWNGSVNTFKHGGDVGEVQIRSTDKPNNSLIVRPDDRDNDLFVLVIGSSPKYKICGEIKGIDAKKPEFLKDYNGRPPAYFVPQSKLTNIK